MCKFCYPILGYTVTHKESECALRQSAVCSVCGPSMHFDKDCPKLPRPVSDSQKAIPSIHPLIPLDPTYFIAHSNQGYIEYRKLHMLEKTDLSVKIEKNRTIVEEHLKKRGYVLKNPYTDQEFIMKDDSQSVNLKKNICSIPRKR
jgi:hypothetical protein